MTRVKPNACGCNGVPCSWWKKIQEPGSPGWGSLKNWGNKICSWVLRDSELALTMPSNNGKLQARPLVRGGAPHQQTSRRKIWSRVPAGCLTPRQTGRLTVSSNITLTLTFLTRVPIVWRYNLGTLFLVEINTGTWPSRLGESQIWASKNMVISLAELDPRKPALARPSNRWKLQTRPLVREGVPHQQIRNLLKII
jgi:hypothetical protein